MNHVGMRPGCCALARHNRRQGLGRADIPSSPFYEALGLFGWRAGISRGRYSPHLPMVMALGFARRVIVVIRRRGPGDRGLGPHSVGAARCCREPRRPRHPWRPPTRRAAEESRRMRNHRAPMPTERWEPPDRLDRIGPMMPSNNLAVSWPRARGAIPGICRRSAGTKDPRAAARPVSPRDREDRRQIPVRTGARRRSVGIGGVVGVRDVESCRRSEGRGRGATGGQKDGKRAP